MIQIYHNNRCGKSRQTLALLKEIVKEDQIEIIYYLANGLSENEILEIKTKLNLPIIDFIRKNENEFKPYKKQDLNENELIKLLVTIPKLLERPIVINGTKAIIGRPPENVKNLF